MQVDRIMANQVPNLQGKTTVFGLNRTATTWLLYGQNIAGSGPFDALQHIAYFRPAKTGTYKFLFSSIDDVGYLWLGAPDRSGFTLANRVYFNEFRIISATPYSYQVTTADVFIPFRFLFFNHIQHADCNLVVTDPDGVIIGSRTVNVDNGQFVSGCSAPVQNAAPFPF